MINHGDNLDGEAGATGRRRRRLFRQRKIPVRYLVPNFFTLLSLCAGVTAIRMAIESRHEFAIALIVAAALLDAVDGRVARALKAQSRFGAELDSLADFVNFGVAPAIVVYTWGLGGLKGFGWLAALVFTCGMSLRLARFNAMLEVDKPKWQSGYFTGMPAPAGAITVLLPLFLDGIGLAWMPDLKHLPLAVSLYTLALAGLLVATIPTFSGKLLGERISREWVLFFLVVAAALVGLLVTFPFPMLAIATLLYLASIPLSYRRYRRQQRQWDSDNPAAEAMLVAPPTAALQGPPGETKH